MNFLQIVLLTIALVCVSGCAKDQLPGGVRTVSVAPASKRPPMVLAPARATAFARMAEERGSWAVNELRAAIGRELAASGRFQMQSAGAGDAVLAIESLRHGLIEVSANQYAVTVAGTVAIERGGASIGQREFSGTSGEIRSLAEFEDPANYDVALQGVFNKVALELVSAL